MLILGIDFETTFTDPIDVTKARIIEIGAVLWDAKRNFPLALMNLLLFDEEIESQFDDRITGLTGLTLADLKKYGRSPSSGINTLIGLMGKGEYMMAHNGTNFDKPLLEAECARHVLPLASRPWLDSSVDVEYPKHIETRKLAFLAPEHGFLNPFAHRAVFDVLSMLRVQSHYPIERTIARSLAKKVVLRAITRKPWEDAGKSNEAAKARGFRFSGDKKVWLKTVLESEVEAELKLPGIQTEVYEVL